MNVHINKLIVTHKKPHSEHDEGMNAVHIESLTKPDCRHVDDGIGMIVCVL